MIQFGLESPEVQEEAKMKHARGGGKRQDDILFTGEVWFSWNKMVKKEIEKLIPVLGN